MPNREEIQVVYETVTNDLGEIILDTERFTPAESTDLLERIVDWAEGWMLAIEEFG